MSRLKSRNKYFSIPPIYFLKSLAIKPTRIAATIVPSRTPSRCLNIINDKIAAITVIDESNAILVLPKSVLNTSETALTVASPGNIATFATISINTPKPRIKQPTISDTTFIAYVSGCINPSNDIVKSMKNENNAIIGSCNKF